MAGTEGAMVAGGYWHLCTDSLGDGLVVLLFSQLLGQYSTDDPRNTQDCSVAQLSGWSTQTHTPPTIAISR